MPPTEEEGEVMISDKLLDEIIAAGRAATPGPFKTLKARTLTHIKGSEGQLVCSLSNSHDSKFIELAGTHMLALAEELKCTRAALVEAKKDFEFLSCDGMDDGDFFVKEFDELVVGTIAMANRARAALAHIKQIESEEK